MSHGEMALFNKTKSFSIPKTQTFCERQTLIEANSALYFNVREVFFLFETLIQDFLLRHLSLGQGRIQKWNRKILCTVNPKLTRTNCLYPVAVHRFLY